MTFIYHQSNEITESFFIKRYAMCEFIKVLCSYKIKNMKGKTPKNARPAFYDYTLKYLVNILELYEAEVIKQTNPSYLNKESLLNLLQNLADSIISYSEDSLIEGIFQRFVLHEFSVSIFIVYLIIYA